VFAVYAIVRERRGAAQRLLLSGGLTKSPLIRAMIADVFGIDAALPHNEEATPFGAALLAAEAAGLSNDPVETARSVGYAAPLRPNDANASAYREAFARYERLVAQSLA